MTGDQPRMLRVGAISAEELRGVLAEVEIALDDASEGPAGA